MFFVHIFVLDGEILGAHLRTEMPSSTNYALKNKGLVTGLQHGVARKSIKLGKAIVHLRLSKTNH